MRSHCPESCEISICFKHEADAVSQAEIDLLLMIWPELLVAMQAAEKSEPSDIESDLA